MRSSSIVILDVGGERFIALKGTLCTLPTSRLGKLVRAESVRCRNNNSFAIETIHIYFTISKILEFCDEFVPGDTPVFFFDKNPENFPSILNIYRTAGRIFFCHS